MKKILLLCTLLPLFTLTKAQTEIAGEYRLYDAKDSSKEVPVISKLSLYCNHTFLMEDSILTPADFPRDSFMIGILKGTWTIKQNHELDIAIDTVLAPSAFSRKLKHAAYIINGNTLFQPLLTKREYNQQMNQVKKEVSEKYPVNSVKKDYKLYTTRTVRTCYKKTAPYYCP